MVQGLMGAAITVSICLWNLSHHFIFLKPLYIVLLLSAYVVNASDESLMFTAEEPDGSQPETVIIAVKLILTQCLTYVTSFIACMKWLNDVTRPRAHCSDFTPSLRSLSLCIKDTQM